MLISYQWLQSYFAKPLPSPEELAKLFTFHAFEVEAIEKRALGMGGVPDTVFDIKILPDRAHYCLSHRGVVGEVSALTGMPIVEMLKAEDFPVPAKTRELKINILEPKLCRRYIGRIVENVKIEKSSGWLKDLLENIGQRSINTVVDSANFVMFDLGQPLHAFDADKVKGDIVVRLAKDGERITTLDNKDVSLDEKTLVIADDEGPLAIAGIKGGKRAEVTESTTNLILESANFEPANIRKTSTRLQIKTDAQKRYENEITPVLAEKAMDEFSVFIKSMDKDKKAIFGEKIDVYPAPVSKREISFDISDVKKYLGIEIPEERVIEILNRLEIGVEAKPSLPDSVARSAESGFREKSDMLQLAIPAVRLDLEISQDIVEEVGRLYGYENIKTADLPAITRAPAINKNFYYQAKIRKILTELGYAEVYTYAFQNSGEVELQNPIASDKAFMRKDLSALDSALELNSKHAPLLGLSDVRTFEIGKVFKKGFTEHTSLSVAFWTSIKKKQSEIVKTELQKIADAISAELQSSFVIEIVGNRFEINLDEYLSKLPEPISYDVSFENQGLSFKRPSQFPFMVRDVALFVPVSVTPEEVGQVIREGAGELVVKGPDLFDIFEKGEKKSLAFRMIFQSNEKTLTDDEANGFMNSVISALEKRGWEVRK